MQKAERLLRALEKTYSNAVPASQVPRLALWEPYLLLVRVYLARGQVGYVIETNWRLLTCLGYVIERQEGSPPAAETSFEIAQWGLMVECVIEAWVHLWTGYSVLGAVQVGRKAEEFARRAYMICVGEEETFDDMYGEVARQAIHGEVDLGQAFHGMRVP